MELREMDTTPQADARPTPGPAIPAAGPPTFLVGAERSGTTLLRLMLDFHPRVAWCNEFEYSVDAVSGDGWPDLGAYREMLRGNRIFRAHGFAIDPALGYPDLVRDFLEQRRLRVGKPVVGATVHRHFDRLTRIWPDARFIHIVRDPRDVARSCIPMGWAGNVWTGVGRWIEAERTWEAVRGRLDPSRWTEVSYENLLADPEGQLARLCDFLGEPYDPAMMSYAEASTYERPDPKLAYQWRRKLSPREIRLVESRVGPMLAGRGYEPSGLPALRVGAAGRLLLRCHDRAGRIRHAVGFLGWRLYLADRVSRRVGPASWRAAVRRRTEQKLISALK